MGLVYKERECVFCQKVFKPGHAAQVTCSPECRRKRAASRRKELFEEWREQATKNALAVDSQAALIDRQVVRIAELEDALEEAQNKVASLAALCSQLQQNATKIGNEKELLTCERLHVKGTSLPCGDREECFAGKKCKKVPKGKTSAPKQSFGMP